MEFKQLVVEEIRTWQGVEVPNKAAEVYAADLEASMKALRAVRHTMRFEYEPAGFETALQECKE